MKEAQIGIVIHYYSNLSVGIIELSDTLKVGDTIHVKGAHDDFTQTVASMQIEHDSVLAAGKGQQAGIKVSGHVHPHDKVYKVS
jgi:putative protease